MKAKYGDVGVNENDSSSEEEDDDAEVCRVFFLLFRIFFSILFDSHYERMLIFSSFFKNCFFVFLSGSYSTVRRRFS